jgi:hypothetical protein
MSDPKACRDDYPGRTPRYDVPTVMEKVYDTTAERWRVA